MLITFIACLFLPLEYGVLVGIAANFGLILRSAANPKISIHVEKVRKSKQPNDTPLPAVRISQDIRTLSVKLRRVDIIHLKIVTVWVMRLSWDTYSPRKIFGGVHPSLSSSGGTDILGYSYRGYKLVPPKFLQGVYTLQDVRTPQVKNFQGYHSTLNLLAL